jgi:molybdopterin molybdotransferase
VDEPVNAAQIRNSNWWLLRSSLKKWGIDHVAHAHVPDDRLQLQAALEKALTSDMIILSGGVSAGDADYVPGVLEGAGVKKLFHKIAIKPGKPVWCGIAPGGGMVFGLPGNPFSCMVGFVLLIQPWLQASFGLPVPGPLGLPMQTARKKNTPLDEFFPVRLSGSPAGLLPVTLNGSGDIRMGLEASALALHPAECGDLAEGEQVLCYPLA